MIKSTVNTLIIYIELYDRDSKALKSKKIKNKFEQRIDNEPELLNTNDKFSFFERTFATKVIHYLSNSSQNLEKIYIL